ncbi:MAG: slipin family protein [Phaeodactylibacter sp.]|uniref:slipin family protein n=1 Tax=Phaeodactylibacter sp. TaxID=1940289 RepID=UPI0032ECA81F
MKFVTISRHEIGLLFRAKSFVGVRLEGWHVVGWRQELLVFDRTKPLVLPIDLSILLEDERFRAEVHLVEVRDYERCLAYRDGLFDNLLSPGRYVYWKSGIEYNFRMVDTRKDEVGAVIEPELLTKLVVFRQVHRYDVAAYETGLLLVDGELKQQLSAGRHYFWKTAEDLKVLLADLRVQTIEVSGQEILTKDRVGIRLNFQLQYRITNVERALLEVSDMPRQLYLLVQLALRSYVGTRTLDELLAGKDSVYNSIRDELAQAAESLGVAVLSGGLKDIILPGEIREIMNRVLVAEKQAQANTILRRDEAAATRSLLNSAKLMEDNAMLLRLKEMEYVEKIAEKINSLSVSGGGQVIDQLRELFIADKK